jgi:prevent-host-death family protein
VYTIVVIKFYVHHSWVEDKMTFQADLHLGAKEARAQFADLLGRVHYRGETVIVERSGKPMVAVIPIELYEKIVAEREARFAIIDRLREKAPTLSEEEVFADVTEAIAAVRASR